jgi:hypothetical protein
VRYLLLVYDEGEWESHQGLHVSADQRATARLIASEELQPVATATTVRVRDGEVLITDGPYIEGAEVASGFYVLDAGDRDEAVKLASMIPASSVQLRQLAGISGL